MIRRPYRNFDYGDVMMGMQQKSLYAGEKVTGISRVTLQRYKQAGYKEMPKIGRPSLISAEGQNDLACYMR